MWGTGRLWRARVGLGDTEAKHYGQNLLLAMLPKATASLALTLPYNITATGLSHGPGSQQDNRQPQQKEHSLQVPLIVCACLD